jgi:hypothetical protein
MTASDEKILDTFVQDGRLVRMPARHSKRLVVLSWLVERFEPGGSYPERQVNEILQQVDPDYAMLRRYLVDAGLMQREQGIYRRTPAPNQPAV